MASRQERGGLVGALSTGIKDIPRNASWLLGRAVASGGDDGGDGDGERSSSGVIDTVKQASLSLRAALPGDDSVEARLERARIASARAREAEQEALDAATRAHQLSAEADDVDKREKAHLKEVRDEQARAVKERVAEARREADARVAREQEAAKSDADDTVARERTASEARTVGARESAEEAQRDAEERYHRATELLAQARALADDAATAANDAAEQARAQAEQIAADAQREADGVAEAVSRAEELRASTARTAADVARSVDDPKLLPGRLSELSKAELVKLAAAQGVGNGSAKTKQQLIAAIDKSKS